MTPLGPFLFALALQPALKMAAESGACVLAYLDDVHVCGPRENVISVIETLIEETQKIRLKCNPDKCWATKPLEASHIKFKSMEGEVPTVLGAPLDPDMRLPTNIIPAELMDRIGGLPDLQIAIHLLRYVHSSKFTQLFRLTSASASKPLAKAMMRTTRGVLVKMLDCDPTKVTDSAWRQAQLPMGPGLGFTDLVSMAPFMSHASILEAFSRLAEMDPLHLETSMFLVIGKYSREPKFTILILAP